LFGEIAVLDGKPRSANVTALTNCELMVLERRELLPFLERNPGACMKLMEMLYSAVQKKPRGMGAETGTGRLASDLANGRPFL
jgi:CRP-like cAMP-binding protein